MRGHPPNVKVELIKRGNVDARGNTTEITEVDGNPIEAGKYTFGIYLASDSDCDGVWFRASRYSP